MASLDIDASSGGKEGGMRREGRGPRMTVGTPFTTSASNVSSEAGEGGGSRTSAKTGEEVHDNLYAVLGVAIRSSTSEIKASKGQGADEPISLPSAGRFVSSVAVVVQQRGVVMYASLLQRFFHRGFRCSRGNICNKTKKSQSSGARGGHDCPASIDCVSKAGYTMDRSCRICSMHSMKCGASSIKSAIGQG